MRVDGWNREWMMDGQVLLRFLPWQRGNWRPLVLPPLIWGRNVQITVLGADVLEGRWSEGFLEWL